MKVDVRGRNNSVGSPIIEILDFGELQNPTVISELQKMLRKDFGFEAKVIRMPRAKVRY